MKITHTQACYMFLLITNNPRSLFVSMFRKTCLQWEELFPRIFSCTSSTDEDYLTLTWVYLKYSAGRSSSPVALASDFEGRRTGVRNWLDGTPTRANWSRTPHHPMKPDPLKKIEILDNGFNCTIFHKRAEGALQKIVIPLLKYWRGFRLKQVENSDFMGDNGGKPEPSYFGRGPAPVSSEHKPFPILVNLSLRNSKTVRNDHDLNCTAAPEYHRECSPTQRSNHYISDLEMDRRDCFTRS